MILHIDMDAFYASVEQLDHPELKGKCVIVGGSSNRGVVSAASYEARKYGVHSAMPIFQAKKKCPQGVFTPPRISRYKAVSKEIMALLRTYTPVVEPVSIDEAYMDLSGCEQMFGDPETIAISIKRNIKDTVQLTCSVGVAPNKFLAKIASDMDKPDGFMIIPESKVNAFIESLPIRKVPGVGAMMHKKLDAMGIKMLGDVKRFSEASLLRRLGKFGNRLFELASGMDPSPVTPTAEHKSISSEETLAVNTSDKSVLCRYMLRQSEDVGRQLRQLELKAKTVTIKIKHGDFKQKTRSNTISTPTQSSETIYKEAKKLLGAYPIDKQVRLIGVGVSGLVSKSAPTQLDLFNMQEKEDDRWERVDKALDSISQKFGKSAVKRATLKTLE